MRACGAGACLRRASPAARALQSRLITGPWPHINPRRGAAGVAVCVLCAGLPPTVTGGAGGQRGRTRLRCHQHKKQRSSRDFPLLPIVTLALRCLLLFGLAADRVLPQSPAPSRLQGIPTGGHLPQVCWPSSGGLHGVHVGGGRPCGPPTYDLLRSELPQRSWYPFAVRLSGSCAPAPCRFCRFCRL